MRRAAAFLALLLCLYWTRAQGESGGVTGNDITQTEIQSEILGVKSTSDQTNISPDIWAELKELRDMAIEHSVELRNSKSKMEKLEQENTAIQARLTASEYKNAVLENVVKDLQRENTDLLHRVTSVEDKNKVLEARMNASENEMEELKIESADMMARLNISEHVMEELKRDNTDLLHRVTSVEDKNKVLEARMNTSENEMEELKIENADMMARLKICENEVEELKRQNAGLFTAPVRGAYYFSFTTLDGRSNVYRRVYLYHNDKRVLFSYNYSANTSESVSNSLVLQMEKEDVVYMVLPGGCSVYDDRDDHTTFNGFLLFPL
ncbi:heavy metal-binding protein HIP-like isoform X3 [Scomber scombrus]|uniref:Heavy metal-binding protein HIP-like isoform X3 n=1 Tax=Scomber scombrus TaxID=13677 RepID=A0AAV1PBY8_SCOSC